MGGGLCCNLRLKSVLESRHGLKKTVFFQTTSRLVDMFNILYDFCGHKQDQEGEPISVSDMSLTDHSSQNYVVTQSAQKNRALWAKAHSTLYDLGYTMKIRSTADWSREWYLWTKELRNHFDTWCYQGNAIQRECVTEWIKMWPYAF